jgi:hypothetical protein
MKIPPYGKPLKALLEAGQIPGNDVYLYIGSHAWEKGLLSAITKPDRTLVLPPNHLPEQYEWPVNGCDILIIESSSLERSLVEDIVYVLFISGAKQVISISPDLQSNFYEKDL